MIANDRKFRAFRAFKINNKIIPKDKIVDEGRFLSNKFMVSISDNRSGKKNDMSCKSEA